MSRKPKDKSHYDASKIRIQYDSRVAMIGRSSWIPDVRIGGWLCVSIDRIERHKLHCKDRTSASSLESLGWEFFLHFFSRQQHKILSAGGGGGSNFVCRLPPWPVGKCHNVSCHWTVEGTRARGRGGGDFINVGALEFVIFWGNDSKLGRLVHNGMGLHE